MKLKLFNGIVNTKECNRDAFFKLCFSFTVLYRVKCTLFYIENDAEIFPAHFTWKVAEKGFKIVFIMNKLAMIISFEIILKCKNIFFLQKPL